VFVPGKPFQPSPMFSERLELTLVEQVSGGPLYGKLLVLPATISLGWKGMPWTNSLAYYEHSQITEEKSFITLGTGVVFTTLLFFITYKWAL
jgi:hypothetical protein